MIATNGRATSVKIPNASASAKRVLAMVDKVRAESKQRLEIQIEAKLYQQITKRKMDPAKLAGDLLKQACNEMDAVDADGAIDKSKQSVAILQVFGTDVRVNISPKAVMMLLFSAAYDENTLEDALEGCLVREGEATMDGMDWRKINRS
jgi:Holliday junction resolvasome RuvABC ATP-dependent DNA helicase subunit